MARNQKHDILDARLWFQAMMLIIGLGNPGTEYEKTRHNAGWLFLDYLRSLPEFNFGAWSEKKRLHALVSNSSFSARDDNQNIILAKPTTYMNNSGLAVKTLVTAYHVPRTMYHERLIVVHDDMDIPFGGYKMQTDRGPAGHHGVESVIEHLGTKNFTRVRIGIAPEQRNKAMDIVLKRFSRQELNKLEEVFQQMTSTITLNNHVRRPTFVSTSFHRAIH